MRIQDVYNMTDTNLSAHGHKDYNDRVIYSAVYVVMNLQSSCKKIMVHVKQVIFG